MRGEFIGVWPETWREIWLPLIEQPFGEDDTGLADDVFCELYQELAKALSMPTAEAATVVVIEDAVTLREIFEGAARRSSNQELRSETVEAAFKDSGATEEVATEGRKRLVVAALTSLVGQPAAPFVDAQLRDVVSDRSKVDGARWRAIERTINDRQKSREAFEGTRREDLAGERAVVGFFESVYGALEQFEEPGDDRLTNRYFNLLTGFIDKFSLRYDLRRPCILCPTLPGMFTALVRELDALSIADQNIGKRLRDFKEAVQDLRLGPTEGRVSNCVIKQVMFLEAVAAASGQVVGSDLAALCKALECWPHPAVRQSLLSLYGFASDFPGVRHGTPSTGMKRDIDMRDMVAMSILLTGFTPYLESRLSADAIFGGSVIHVRPIPPVGVRRDGPASSSDTFWKRE